MALSPSAVMQAYSPPLSLWRLVEQHVPLFEQEEVKSMLGSHIVDQSLELHDEVEMLLDIWRDMRDEAQETKLVASRLPEPPNQRERLIQEINFFAESVKEKAKQKGVDPKNILKKHNNNIIDYASELSRPGSSIGRTSRSSDGRETPMMVASPDGISRAYEVTDEVEAVSNQLNVNTFDEICAHLRSTLETEVDHLVMDIEFLQSCLDNEANIRDSIDTPQLSREPTLTELREERTSLEKELLLTDNLTYTPTVDKPLFNDALTSKKPLPDTFSTAGAKSTNMSPRRGPTPLKANQSISPHIGMDRQTTPPSAVKRSSRTGNDFPLKAVHDIQFTKTPKEMNASDNPCARSSVPFSTGSSSFLPNQPKVSMPENISKRNAFQKSSDSSVYEVSTHTSRINDNSTDSRVNRGRRTLSPGRVRVVNLNSIVGMHSGKADTSVAETIQSSNPLLPFNPAPPDSPRPESNLRPTSADRFRKMVMGCRDGE